MWCPSATLSVWANAWLAGRAAPDDVLDALSRWAPTQSVNVYDSVSTGSDGPASADGHDGGGVVLLQTLRTAPGSRRGFTGASRSRLVRPVFPVPGDVRDLPAGTRFEHDALAVGEAVIVAEADGSSAVGLVPDVVDAGDEVDPSGLSWTAYRLPDIRVGDDHDLGEAEYTMRSAVRSAADALDDGELYHVGDAGVNPRLLIEQLSEASRAHRIPNHAPMRAVRVLENAARVDAIITVCHGLADRPGQCVADVQRADAVLRPLAVTVRSARVAAVDAILRSAWSC